METSLRADILSLKNSCSTKDFRSAIETLLKLHRNALDQPDEEKLRRLRKSNQKIHEILWRYQAARMFLQHAGWIEDPEDDSRLMLFASSEQLTQVVDVLLEHRMVKPSGAEWVSESKVVDYSKTTREHEKKEMAMRERDREYQECLKDKAERKVIAAQVRAEHREDFMKRRIQTSPPFSGC